MDCCDIYESQFDRESALTEAQRYRRKGLRGPARVILDTLAGAAVRGATVLEIGGGVSGLSIELLKQGASSAVNVELSRAYRDAAQALALEAGVADRFELIAGDGAEVVRGMGRFDLVVMNRVVCCYPEGQALMRVGAGAAARSLAVSSPTIGPLSRTIVGAENWRRARRGEEFRAFVHPAETLRVPSSMGFTEVFLRRRPMWTVRLWERAAAVGIGERAE